MMLPKPKRLRLTPNEYQKQTKELFERQGYRCARCGQLKPLTRDHKRKRSQGGGDEASNAQGLCWECHNAKDNLPRSKSPYWK